MFRRKLLHARERRLRLANYGTGGQHELLGQKEQLLGVGVGVGADHELGRSVAAMPNGAARAASTNNHNHKGPRLNSSSAEMGLSTLIDTPDRRNLVADVGPTDRTKQQQQQTVASSPPPPRMSCNQSESTINQVAGQLDGLQEVSYGPTKCSSSNMEGLQPNQSVSSSCGCASEAEFLATSCTTSSISAAPARRSDEPAASTTETSYNNNNNNHHCANNNNQRQQQPTTKIMSQLIVESTKGSNNQLGTSTTISLSTAPTRLLAACDTTSCSASIGNRSPGAGSATPQLANEAPPAMESTTVGHNRRSLAAAPTGRANLQVATNDYQFNEKRSSETTLVDPNSAVRGRSMGSATLTTFQLVKLQAAQRQINQNETTTRLLIAVMIVFLICEFPAGILAALCAILGQDFFENVYQPTGTLTDLFALINSSVNFILYCFMSTQFRTTFYRVVLHCPAPNVPHHEQYEANKDARKRSARKSTLYS